MMSLLGPAPLRVCRAVLKELRALKGAQYKDTMAYRYVMEQFRSNQVQYGAVWVNNVTGERYCRAQREALHASQTYLCLLGSTRLHLQLHQQYHGRGERPPQELAQMLGLRLPSQPGGKGWEQ